MTRQVVVDMGKQPAREDVIGYTLHGNRYLNVTSRCNLRCAFCPKFRGSWSVHDYNLRLYREPSIDEMLASVGDPQDYREVVFCGYGEPTLRLYDVLEVGRQLRQKGGFVRLNTDGLANVVYGRDVTPDLEDNIDALSISMNGQDEATYNRHCRPPWPGAYTAMLDFAKRAHDFVPHVTLTAIDGLEGVDIDACRKIATGLGVGFRRRVLDLVG